MKKNILILSFGYWFSAYSLGLLLHPYKTVRELARRRVFGPLVLVPVVMWLVFWFGGMVGLRFGGVILWLLGLVATARFLHILSFLFWWLTIFLGMWQAVLIYLFLRFRLTLRG
ncbi:hypothetical protein A2783_05750 [Microgenomates group bacterium RIFCSPHIGHO2_01_FULL_45_11]|nr:MAG: hypothetical protein A2783_05750 [Microgenomates group bacterium RIFCSPHIGHO2_01_FULL_45_11]